MKNSSLVHSEFASEISIWLQHYPKKLLTVQQLLFLLNQEVYINRYSFDEEGIIKGRWSKAYQQLKNNGMFRLFGYTLNSECFRARFEEIRNNQRFNDPHAQFYTDLCSLLYCDQQEIPITFDYDDLFNLDTNTNRNGYNFYTNFARSLMEYTDFVEKEHEKGLVDFIGRSSLMLSFSFSVDVPRIITQNTKKIIDNRIKELEANFLTYYHSEKSEANFNMFICANLPFKTYVNIGPSEIFSYMNNPEYQTMRDKYLQLQWELSSPEKLKEYEEKLEDQTSDTTGSSVQVKASDVRLGIHKFHTHDIPHEHSYKQKTLICNRRIRNNTEWLISIQNFQPTLNSVMAGIAF